MIYRTDLINETTIAYIPKLKGRSYIIYISAILFIIASLISLNFINIDLYVKTAGVTRPIIERTEVKSVISGIIDSIFYREGGSVEKGDVILRIKDPSTNSKRNVNNFEISQRELFIHDLSILTSINGISTTTLDTLRSPLYKQQVSRFIHKKTDQEASLKKATKELELNTPLARDKVISVKEFFDIQINLEKIQSEYKAFVQEQLTSWQQDLSKFRLELSQFKQQDQQIKIDAGYYEVRSPLSGIIQGINTRYSGGLLQANEVLCNISPENTLIGECYVQTKDIGLLKVGQPARYQFEAFNYTYFGFLSGKIINIDNDYSSLDNKAFYKVRCSFDSTQLYLKNGFSGKLKKGLGFQANFLVARRSLWQLLFDKMDDWLNPNAPPKTA
ncbi:MAG: HlyD family efflux transporter periplasmic adaptor subunit [Chitinophagaceae bacterium]|nr:HlyD family efflux transporter periplasmic adaptor subunit [Chitinophagaceae bacterium]